MNNKSFGITELDYRCAVLSDLAYGNADQALKQGFTNAVLVQSEDETVEVLICEDDSHIYAAFRGTEICEFKDVMRNFAVLKHDRLDQYRIHRGFFEAWQLVAKVVAEELMERSAIEYGLADAAEREPKRVVYTGHSLGAAIATIAAATHVPSYLITFGSPRVGGKKLREHFDTLATESRRFTNGADIVTLVPNIGYRHVSPPIHILNGTAYADVPAPMRWFDLLFNSRIIEDHSIKSYVYEIGRFLDYEVA